MHKAKLSGLAGALIAGILLLPATGAEAHGLYDRHAISYVRPRADLPHWLRHDLAFRRWYGINYRYFARSLGWRHLHGYYLRDHRYHRQLRRAAHRDYRGGGRHAHRYDRRHNNRHARGR